MQQQSESGAFKEVTIQVVDYNQPAEDFYLYADGVDALRPPKDAPPIKIQGREEREICVFVKNQPADKQSTLLQWATVDDPINPGNQSAFFFFADDAETTNVRDTIVVLSLLKNIE
ncbi:hypothetical protein H0H92_004152 [Tricholoma furcatifolium]|nr:hypothetical protein H0H92_004152 [Tricholoma furcatifolium]